MKTRSRAPRADLRTPQQARSRATLDRLLAAAAALLAERRFEEASVAQIVARAGSSVGAFYARFRDKQALLQHLDERLFEGGRALWDSWLEPARWRDVPAAEIVGQLVTLLVRKRRQNRGLLRALALYTRSGADTRFLQRAAGLSEHVLGRLSELLVARRSEIGHPQPLLAIRTGLFMVDAAVREAVLFDEVAYARLSDARLAAQLTRAYLAYLDIRRSRGGH